MQTHPKRRDAGHAQAVNRIVGGCAVQSGATLIQILSTPVLSVRLLRQGLVDNCPSFVIRGNASVENVTTPDIYINEMHAQDPSVLHRPTPSDIEAIEVYSGSSAPAGLARAKHGRNDRAADPGTVRRRLRSWR